MTALKPGDLVLIRIINFYGNVSIDETWELADILSVEGDHKFLAQLRRGWTIEAKELRAKWYRMDMEGEAWRR